MPLARGFGVASGPEPLCAAVGGEQVGAIPDRLAGSGVALASKEEVRVAGTLAVLASGPGAVCGAGMASGELGIACSGSVLNQDDLWDEVLAAGGVRRSPGWAWLITQLIAQSRQRTMVNRFLEVLRQLTGGFTVAMAGTGLLAAARDPSGCWPLWIGRAGAGRMVASQPWLLVAMGGEVERPVEPGEVVVLEPGQEPLSLRPWPTHPPLRCLLGAVLFSTEDGQVADLPVCALRQELGRVLAQVSPVAAGSVVVPLGLESLSLALGFARASGGLLEPAVLVAGLEPTVVGERVAGRDVALVAPAAGLTAAGVAMRRLERAGARSVSLRCTLPAPGAPCPLGAHLAPSLDRGLGGDISLEQLETSLEVMAGSPGGSTCAACVGGSPPLVAGSQARQLGLFGEGVGS